MVVMSLAAHLVTRRRPWHFHRHQPSLISQSLYRPIDRGYPQPGHLLLCQAQHFVGGKRTIVPLKDLAYFPTLLSVPSKSLR